jgi:arylsulfatase A-like enzyme/tetratricopeptide (TPR) repeat protein
VRCARARVCFDRRARAAAILLATGALAGGCAPAPEQPDRILLVTIDTLRADRLGCYGARGAHTPTIDGLARDGVRFETVISPAPLTLPSHATILTGLDPDQHGVRHNSLFQLRPGIPLLSERMRETGRATAAFVGAFVLDGRFGLARGFDVYDDEMGSRRSGRSVVGFAERRASDVVDSFLAWLEQAPDRFFAWVHVYDPHADYDPPAGFSLGFAGRLYDGEIAYVDAQLARLLERLDARFPRAGTLVVVTADHGEALGEHGESTHSYSLYDATQRVPLILAGPGFRGGRAVGGVARLADVAPTLAAAVGAELPGATGRDLAKALPDTRAYAETVATHLDHGWSALFSARDARWRYVHAPEPELYDLASDPRERRNVVAEQAAVASDFASWIERRRAAARPIAIAGALSGDERERLQALGYVAGAGGPSADDLSGPDPKQRRAVLAAFDRANFLADRGRWAEGHAQLAPFEETGLSFLTIRGTFAVRAGLLEEAARDLGAALARSPGNPEVLRLLGLVEEGRRSWAAARLHYESALRSDPADGAALAGLGRIAEAEGDRAAAEARYREAIERQPATIEARWRLAALLFEGGDEAGAADLLEAGEGQPDSLTALRVAAAELASGDAASAAARLERAIEGIDLPPPLVLPAAAILTEGGRSEAAQRIYELALRADPDSWEAQNGVAWGLVEERRDLDRALDLAQSAAKASKGEPAVLDTLATVQLRRGDPRAALATVERALPRAGAELRPHLEALRTEALAALGRSARAADTSASSPPP